MTQKPYNLRKRPRKIPQAMINAHRKQKISKQISRNKRRKYHNFNASAALFALIISVSVFGIVFAASSTAAPDYMPVIDFIDETPHDKIASRESDNKEKEEERYTVTVKRYGEEDITCDTPSIKVEQLLDKLEIELSDSRHEDIGSENLIVSDMEIEIDKIEEKVISYTETIPYDTVYTDIQTIPKGEVQINTAGKNGEKTVYYKEHYVNGELTSTEYLSEEITLQPQNATAFRGVGGTINGKNYSYYIDVKATTYCCGTITYTGLPAEEGVIAVDPDVIELGSRVYVKGDYGDFGECIAADIGGGIKGNIIDIFLEETNPLFANFGWRDMRVYILE